MATPSLIVAAAILGGSSLRGDFTNFFSRRLSAVVWSALTSALRAFALLVAVLFLIKSSADIARGSVVLQFLCVTAAVMFSRSLLHRWTRGKILSGEIISSRAMIVGDRARIAGTVDGAGFIGRLRRDGIDVRRLRTWQSSVPDQDLIDATIKDCRSDNIDSVIIFPSARTIGLAERMVSALSETPVTVHVLPFQSFGAATPGATSIGGQASIVVSHSPIGTLGKLLKRAFDTAAASLLLFMLMPLFLGIAAAIKCESSGPVFFRQTRHGYGNRHFRVFKFRSMRVMEDGAAFRQASKNDPRITAVGRFIRSTNLDELPQLINVIMGDMSLVGPRPHPVALNEDFAARIRMFHRRHNILPGITGWAQVNGHRGETDTYEKMLRRLEHDLWYLDHWSMSLDLRILVLTVFSSAAYRNAA